MLIICRSIDDCIGMMYTCPDCKETYLLPSPYRPVHPASDININDFQQSIIDANNTISMLKSELLKTQEELDIEHRSRRKSNEALMSLQRKHNSFTATNPAAPSQIKIPKALDVQKFKSHFNDHIEQLENNLKPAADTNEAASILEKIKLVKENQTIIEELCNLRNLATATAQKCIYEMKSAKNLLEATKRHTSDNLAIPIQEVQETQMPSDQIAVHSAELQRGDSKSYNSVIELQNMEKDLHAAYQQLRQGYDDIAATLPDIGMINSHSTISRKMKRIRKKNVSLVKIKQRMKDEKWRKRIENLISNSNSTKMMINSYKMRIINQVSALTGY